MITLRVEMLISPHTSVCMIPKKLVALSTKPVNGVLVIPMRHGSHISRESKSNDPRSPSDKGIANRARYLCTPEAR
jgi:hypothetical protein